MQIFGSVGVSNPNPQVVQESTININSLFFKTTVAFPPICCFPSYVVSASQSH